jgi:hypothetical protein
MQVSSSGAITTTGVISGSNALSASYALNSGLLNDTGSVGFATTGSLLAVSSSQQQISASQQQLSSSFLTLTASFNAVSSSQQQISSSQQQISASLLNVIAVYATTGSNSFRETQSITGSLTVTGQIIAQTLNVQQVTSSIIYSSGSNNFGCDLNSRQTFTGSVLITGSLTIAGASSATSYSGTTIYGSTAVCSAVGKFTTCIDAGTGTFSGALTATGGTINGLLTINRNITGLVLNRDAVTNYNGIYYSTAVCSKWFIGMRENLCSNNHIHYSEQLGQDVLTLNVANGAATFSSTITGTTIYGSTAVCSPVGYFSGCVGIGTTDPYTKLQVNSGNISVLSSCSIGTDGAGDVRKVGFGFKHPDNTVISALINTTAAGTWGLNLHFNVRGGNAVMPTIPAITIVGADDSGNNGGLVGIGTCSPSRKLHIFNNNDTRGILIHNCSTTSYAELHFCASREFRIGTGGTAADSVACNKFYIYDATSSTHRFTINCTGLVGIGITTPSELLHVCGNIRAGNTDAGVNFTSSPYIGIAGTGGQSPLFIAHSSGYGLAYFGYDACGDRLIIATDNGGGNNKIDFSVNAGTATNANNVCGINYAMRINGSGYITKPSQPAFKAGLSTSTSFGANCTIIFNDTASSAHFNIGGHYSTSTGLFTAPVAGMYVFSTIIIYQSMAAGQAMDDAFYIYKNSSLVAYSFRRAEYEAGYTGNAGYYTDHANILLNLAASDTVSIRNNRALDVHGNTYYTYFYGYLLG